MNNVIVIGRLGQDPELRQTHGGPVCRLSLATDESRKNERGEWEKFPEWHRIVLFGKEAENAAKYLSKGSEAAVQGSLRTNKWKDREGIERWTTEIIGHRIQFLSSPSTDSDARGGARGGGARGGTGGGWEGGTGAEYSDLGGSKADDDIPF